ncbi:fumarylacetoacetate hydrolase family protein [Heyndrickxia sporothermodurans]
MKRIQFKLRGKAIMEKAVLEEKEMKILINGTNVDVCEIPWDVPVNGTVYGTLLNYKGALAAFEKQLNEPPYIEPPKAPILYIKPVNTMISYNMPIPLPKGVSQLEVGAALGIVIGKKATKVTEEQAHDFIAGYTVVNDISIPHTSIYRPAVNQKARDGFCPIGPWIVEKHEDVIPDCLRIKVYVNGKLRQENTTENLIRSVGRLLSDITDFMTLNPGDIVLVGIPENPPIVQLGDRIKIEIDQIGTLENSVVSEEELFLGVNP